MNFKFDDKDYDSEKLSDNGKLYLGKLQQIQGKQQQLNLEMADVNILQGHYSNLLKDELPKDEKEHKINYPKDEPEEEKAENNKN